MRHLPAGFDFWRDLVRLDGSAGLLVLGRIVIFAALGWLVWRIENATVNSIAVDLTPYEVAGAALSLLLVLRTNAGYDRWWEARKLWGGIVNQCRDLVVVSLANGPADRRWREDVVHWTIAFAHATRRSLRGERDAPELVTLLGAEEAARVVAAEHMPSYVSARLAAILADALKQQQMAGFAFQLADRDRASLLDHVGGCEAHFEDTVAPGLRGEDSPIHLSVLGIAPLCHDHTCRLVDPIDCRAGRLPDSLARRNRRSAPAPFSTKALNHLPLDEICTTIEKNLLAQLKLEPTATA